MEVGVTDGILLATLGIELGSIDGNEVRSSDDEDDGLAEGMTVGNDVGIFDGIYVSIDEGDEDGISDKKAVGLPEGSSVGICEIDGAKVGLPGL